MYLFIELAIVKAVLYIIGMQTCGIVLYFISKEINICLISYVGILYVGQ